MNFGFKIYKKKYNDNGKMVTKRHYFKSNINTRIHKEKMLINSFYEIQQR